MVLKFCAPWTEEPAASPRSNHDTDDDRAAGEARRSRVEKAWDELLASANRAKVGDDPHRWEKEFHVFFDDSKPVGLGFQPAVPASSSNAYNLEPSESYACVIRDVAPSGLAADYNARCRSVGDYSRVIVENLRVRMVNGLNVANVSYADVLQMMRDAKPSLTLTLADVSSGLASEGFGERSRSLSSLAPPRPTRRRSSLSMGPGKAHPRRDSGSSLEVKSDSLQLPETTASDMAMDDLKTKYLDVKQQLRLAMEQLSALQEERTQAIAKEQDAAARQLETLLQETRKMQRERDDMVAVNKLLLRHKRASVTTQAELETVRTEQIQLQHHQEDLELSLRDLQTQLTEQTLAAQESQEQANQLRHDKEMLALQWQELQEEHRDTQSHVDELHDRLVDAQRAHRAVEVVLAALRTSHAAKTQQVRELQSALEAANARLSASQPPERRLTADVAVMTTQQISITTRIQQQPSASTLSLLEQLRDANFNMEEHRGEILAEVLCHEQKLQQLQEQIHALELVNHTSKHLLSSLHEELREAQNRERKMRNEFTAELEVVRKNEDQEEQSEQCDLKLQIGELEKRCEEECAEKNRLQTALSEFEHAAAARAAIQQKEQEYLVQFKGQLEKGIVVTKFGSRGVPHQRVVYSDSQCHWLSWRSPATSIVHGSLVHPKPDSKADTCDLVEVLAGATTETFARQPPEAPARCLSLVFVHPCRTLDLQAETAAQCQQYLRGFQLLRDEAALKRR